MKFTLEITCDNAAFGDDEESLATQTAFILRHVSARVDSGTFQGKIYDENGNVVGSYQFVEE